MMQTHEELAIDYVNGHRGHLLAERPDPPAGSSDLGVQLALWSTVGVRAIADPRVSSTDVGQIARTQASLAQTAVALTGAAAHRGEINPGVAAHLRQRMETLATGWSAVAHHWSWLRTPDNPAPSPAVTAAAASLYASVADATRSQARWATPDQIDTRLSDVPLVPILRSITEGHSPWPSCTSSCRSSCTPPTDSGPPPADCSPSPPPVRYSRRPATPDTRPPPARRSGPSASRAQRRTGSFP